MQWSEGAAEVQGEHIPPRFAKLQHKRVARAAGAGGWIMGHEELDVLGRRLSHPPSEMKITYLKLNLLKIYVCVFIYIQA